jgi:IS5 family transposase
MFLLANQIDWRFFEESFGPLYVEKIGRPGTPIRLLVGLHYLKQTFNESDESVVIRFLENPYWQYFCGFDYFQHTLPTDPTTLVKWRHRIGPEGMEKLLQGTLLAAKSQGKLTPNHLKHVNVDTTVQEKAIAFPTDARLYHKARAALVKVATKCGITLRQSYERLGKRALLMNSRYLHARQMKRAKRELKKLRVFLGRVIRDIQRKLTPSSENKLSRLLAVAQRIHQQQKYDKNKVYSVHAPEVECIAKGKAHKRYEFGSKVAMVTSSKDNWILGIQSLPGNPYDGHTLESSLTQVFRLTGYKPENLYSDRGYKGTPPVLDGTNIHRTDRKKKSLTAGQWKWFKMRNAIEPIFGHLKQDHRLHRNYLKGTEGDQINALLAGCGFNLRKLLRAFFLSLFKERLFVLFSSFKESLRTFLDQCITENRVFQG